MTGQTPREQRLAKLRPYRDSELEKRKQWALRRIRDIETIQKEREEDENQQQSTPAKH